MRTVRWVLFIVATVSCSDASSGSPANIEEDAPGARTTVVATQAVATPTGTPVETPTPSPGDPARVINVVDGDTIVVIVNGIEERVRYIGVDSPERGVCYEDEATAANESLVGGKTITLEADVENDRDTFGRLLRYVHVDGVFVNEELVRLGVAEATTRYPERTYRDVLLAAEADAKAAGRGLWSACPGLFE